MVEQNSSGAMNPLFSRLGGRTKPYFFKNRFYKGKNEIFLKVKVVGNSVFTGVLNSIRVSKACFFMFGGVLNSKVVFCL